MDYLVQFLQVLSHSCLVLAPIVLLWRDWKYHDRRTRKYHQYTRWLLITSLFAAILSTVFFWSDRIESEKYALDLISRIKNLQSQNQELIAEVNQFQRKNQELELKSRKLERGITSYYDFQGNKRTQNGGVFSMHTGEEFEVFKKMQQLERDRDFEALVNVCEGQKSKTPEWLTPYLVCGGAYLNLGMLDKAVDNLKYVVEQAPGDPSYDQARQILDSLNAL